MTTNTLLAIFGGLLAGLSIGYLALKRMYEARHKDVVEKSERLISETKQKADQIRLSAKQEVYALQEAAKKEEMKKREQLEKLEERLIKKEEVLETRAEQAEKMHAELEKKIEEAKARHEEITELRNREVAELQKIAQMSPEEARKVLLKKVEEEAEADLVAQIKKVEAEFQAKAKEKAKFIIADAIQKYAAEATTESTATMVNLPNEEMKGRIIGREGRNINTFEEIAGVDVIVDETPGSIVISGFDLLRRYVAKVALERLISDGRIHPARIEETVHKVRDEVNVLIKELGEKAMFEAGVTGFNPSLVKLLGRLKFRVSYGQNVLKHSLEVACIASALASEIGANVDVCKKAGLLHDIGKAVDHEISGHHAKIGASIAKKFGMSEEIVHAIEAHHGDPEPHSVEARIVEAANLIANARPGANKENLDTYIKRQQEIETLAGTFEGVKTSHAVQAGSELRVFVEPEKVTDLGAIRLAHDLARKIEKDFQPAGPVKVVVIREKRGEAVAK